MMLEALEEHCSFVLYLGQDGMAGKGRLRLPSWR